MAYFFDHFESDERARLRHLENCFDPQTRQEIEALGLVAGWRCLEVGAGGGSVAQWLAGQVGPSGYVVATDVETRFLAPLESVNLEVRRHRAGKDPLEEQAFDLIHARAVMEHLPDRLSVLRQLTTALKPGGWMLMESADFCSCKAMSRAHDDLFTSVYVVLLEFLVEQGFWPDAGARLYPEFEDVGLVDVRFSGRTALWGGSEPLTAFYVQTFARLARGAVDKRAISEEDVNRFFALITSSDFRAMSHVTCSVRGKRPG